MIQFARVVGLEVSLASNSMLQDLLLKARVGSGVHPKASRYPARRSPFPSVAGSSAGDSVASWSVYSLPTITETETSNLIISGRALEEPSSSRQAVDRSVEKCTANEKSRSNGLKTVQQIKCSEKKKKARMWKWSRKGRLNPYCPVVMKRVNMFLRKVFWKLPHLLKCLPRDLRDPLETKTLFLLYVMQEKHFDESAWALRIKAPLSK